MQGRVAGGVIIVGVRRDGRGAMFRFVDRLERIEFDGGFSMESGRGSGACGCFALPFGYGVPVFLLFLIKFLFPFLLRLFAVSANVAALVAARTLTAFDVFVELTLCLRGNLFSCRPQLHRGRAV